MRNTPTNKFARATTLIALALASACTQAALPLRENDTRMSQQVPSTAASLSIQQSAIVPIAAAAAVGDMEALAASLERGLSAGLSISEAKEVLVQLYAYAGFPRSLNALGQLMQVVNARRERGITDAPGRDPSRAIPAGDELLKVGAANQTRIVGKPVAGPLFDFAPVANQYLQAHLFGDIFERDNLDWQSREVATVSILAALPGVESQLQSHIVSSFNVGLSETQLRMLVERLAAVDPAYGERANQALAKAVAARQG